MPKAYWIAFYRAVHNQEKLTAYAKLAAPAIQAAGGKFLARATASHVYDNGVIGRTVAPLARFCEDGGPRCHAFIIYPPIVVAVAGWSRSRNQWATSMKCTIKSVRIPPPKSQNQRQLRKRYSSNG